MATGSDAILGTEVLYQGWLNVLLAAARLSGEDTKRVLIEHPSGSTVLAYDPERRVAFTVRQTRLPVLHLGVGALPEAVAGVAEDESAAETARRECREEIGVELGKVEAVGHVWMTPSTTTERVHLFLGEYHAKDRVSHGGGAEGELEDLKIREEPLSELWNSAQNDELMDAKLFMLLQALRIRRPDLFAPEGPSDHDK